MDMSLFKPQRTQRSFLDTDVYDRLIPKDHLLVKLNQKMDWSFIEDACRPFYQERGRMGENPVVLFKMLLLAYLYDISERRIEIDCTLHILYKAFLGLEVDEKAPDHSTLTRFRDRLGEEGFRTIFNRLVEQARSAGIVADRLRIVDSTHQLANVDILRANKRQPRDKDDDDKTVLPGSPDPDARFGHKTETKKFFGFKHHIGVDADSGLIVAQATSGGNIADDDYLMPLASGPPPAFLTADKLYDKPHHHQDLKTRGIKSHIIRKSTTPDPEDPQYQYHCRQRKQIERVFAVLKKYHHGGRARYWSLARVRVQNLMTDVVYNLKLLARDRQPDGGDVCLITV
jgi:transposase, IS5 family